MIKLILKIKGSRSKAEFSNYFSSFFRFFLMLINDEPLISGNFNNLSFFQFRFGVCEQKSFFLQSLVDISPLDPDHGSAYFGGSGSRMPKSCGSNGSLALLH